MKCSQCKHDGIKYIFKEKRYKRYCHLKKKIIKNYPYPSWCPLKDSKEVKQ